VACEEDATHVNVLQNNHIFKPAQSKIPLHNRIWILQNAF